MSGSNSNCTDQTCAVDASCRLPVLYLFAGGIAWLLAGIALSLVAAAKLQFPSFLSVCEVLTYGRLTAAASAALTLGFALQLGFGLAFWLLSRTGQSRLPLPGIAFVVSLVLNASVTLGVGAILILGPTGIPGLEIPRQVAPVILAAVGLLSLVGIAAFASAGSGSSSPARAHLLGALVVLPVLYLTAQLGLLFLPIRGVSQAVTAGWFQQGFLFLGLAPIALAALYYLVPLLTERSPQSPSLAPIAFWTWTFLAGWTGAAQWVGGPIPAWWITVSIVASVLLVIPTTLFFLNFQGACLFSRKVAVRFLAVSTISLFAWGGLNATFSLRCAQSVVHFTQFGVGLRELFFFGFLAPAFFAGIYAAVPKLAGRDFPCRISPQVHWFFTAAGVVLMVVSSLAGGFLQGRHLAVAGVPIVAVDHSLRLWLLLNAAGLGLFGFAQLALVANSAWLLFECVKPLKDPVISLFTATPVHSVSGK